MKVEFSAFPKAFSGNVVVFVAADKQLLASAQAIDKDLGGAIKKAIDASRTQCGQAERKDAFKRANQILNEEQPYNFGFSGTYLLGVNKKVQNVKPGPYARLGQARPETWFVQ